jgi:hypothetical protein
MTTQYFDDGSTLSYSGDYSWMTSTPAESAQTVQGWTDTRSVLDQFTDVATQLGRSITTLAGQADAIRNARANNELARYRTLAELKIGMAQADAAVNRAQLGASATSGNGLLILLALGGLAVYAMKK